MLIVQHTPMCPECSALLNHRLQDLHSFYFCTDCGKIYKVIGAGKAEIELIVTDREEENER